MTYVFLRPAIGIDSKMSRFLNGNSGWNSMATIWLGGPAKIARFALTWNGITGLATQICHVIPIFDNKVISHHFPVGTMDGDSGARWIVTVAVHAYFGHCMVHQDFVLADSPSHVMAKLLSPSLDFVLLGSILNQ